MRLGVFFLFFAIFLATASPPAVAQLSPPPPPEVEKPVKKEKPPKGNEQKPPKGDEPKPPEGEEPNPPEGDEPTPPEGDEPTPPEGDEPNPPEENDPKPPEGGEDGGPEGGKGHPDGKEVGSGGDDPAGLDRSTNGSSSGDEDGLSSLVSHAGCSEECDPPGTPTNRGGGEANRNAADAESIGELEGASLVPSAVADASPPVLAVFALFALMVLCLLVGLAGGLRALHGRIRGG
jgi:hypothetical protein